MTVLSPAPRPEASLPLFASLRTASPAPATSPAPDRKVTGLFHAGSVLTLALDKGRTLDARTLRTVMTEAFDGSDAEGAWAWKDAYEAVEIAQLLFLRKYGRAMAGQAGSPARLLAMLARLAERLPTHSRRSEESQALQQFSTPLALGAIAARAAALRTDDLVLEPSAGTGQLAIWAELAGARLALNELAETRAGVLARLFPDAPLCRANAEQINDHLPAELRPTVVLMNPPFSASPKIDGRYRLTAAKHLASALARLAAGGRLVAITGESLAPDRSSWRELFAHWQASGRVVFSAGIPGTAYAKHGTSFETRLTVIDKAPAEDPRRFPESHGVTESVEALLDLVERHVPPRLLPAPAPVLPAAVAAPIARTAARPKPVVSTPPLLARLTGKVAPAPVPAAPPVEPAPVAVPVSVTVAEPTPAEPVVIELAYQTRDWTPAARTLTQALYETYEVQSVIIDGARPHPTKLVQSGAMASVAPPKPGYRPHLPAALVANGLLSDAQLESVITAGEAHAGFLDGHFTVEDNFDTVAAVAPDTQGAVRFRRGWFLGDGTGAGKGRQVAGIILDNWLKGRKRALWISKSDKLIEDAIRDWTALGGDPADVVALSRFRQGATIELDSAILFATYATLRSAERQGKVSRVQQIVDWLGRDFDGALVFDEAHAMANAAGDRTERGEKKPSQQGQAGLRLQNALPGARVVYVSATGATTVSNLAYTARLGLWGCGDFPFASRAAFIAAMEAGGVAAMEVLARDLKALGLYAARSLSFDGVEYELVEHVLTPEQIRIYDAYAEAFQVIHTNLLAALEATNVTGPDGTLNAQAKAAARSTFESNKQRFFNHLITAMKCPTLLASIERDVADGRAAVVQIVSTGEALLDRRLAEIPAEDWGDISIDVTPREYVLDYLRHSFPTQLFEVYSDDAGNLHSRPVTDAEGNPIQSREAVARRDQLVERLASLPPVQSALDQIIWSFGADRVAEITGRSKRVVRKPGAGGDCLAVETRPGSANLGETQAFMDDHKQILVFSDAGGTGRSYHADLGAKNQRRRVHYLLEPGWKADAAIQGLGRSNRTNQAQPPIFRPVTTDVKGEKRFLSTIARRLDTLGAITRGQRQTGGQGLFRAEDNLESPYAAAALRQFFQALGLGRIAGCSLQSFCDHTGLDVIDGQGRLFETLPPIPQFLNRLLALRIDLQNTLFEEFEARLEAEIEGAMTAGVYDVGVETLIAESFRIIERRRVFVHPSGAETACLRIARTDRNQPLSLEAVLALRTAVNGRLLVNAQSGRAALQAPAPARMVEDGGVEDRARLIRPMSRETIGVGLLRRSRWIETDQDRFAAAWQAEITATPVFATSELTVVTGLLLPIWDRLPDTNLRVYRLQTDDGERVIGRLLNPEQLGAVYAALGVDAGPGLSAGQVWSAITERRVSFRLAGGLTLRRARIMGVERVELADFAPDAVDRLKAMGLIGEIISWKLRLFIPTGTTGPDILATLLDRHPVIPDARPSPVAA